MKHAVVLAGTAFALSGTLPAHAVVLEQKWQAGQNIAYDLSLDGSVNLQSPADAAVMWAGIPLEIALKGNGRAQLQTLSVDPSGVGTVAFKLPQLQLNFETWGQQGQWSLRNGASQLMLNGKPLNIGQGLNLTQLNNPTTAIKIDKEGRVKGLEPLQTAAKAPANAEATPVAPEKAIDQGALVTAMVLQSLPALWPGRDVQQGEVWQVNLDVPPALRPGGATNPNAPKSLGTFNMTLKGQEQEGTKTLWRVGVVGNIQVDAAQWRGGAVKPASFQLAPGENPGQRAGRMGSRVPRGDVQFDSATQRVDGDVWFDAEAGQIARAELALNSRAQGRTPKPTGGFGAPSWVDFAGTLQLDRQATTKK